MKFSAYLALDPAGNVWLTGILFESVWLRKFAGHGPAILYETTLATTGAQELPLALAVDEMGNASVIGSSQANGFFLQVSPVGEVLQPMSLPGTPIAIAATSHTGYVVTLPSHSSSRISVLTPGIP